MSVDWKFQLIMGAAMTVGYLLSRQSQRSLDVGPWERRGVLLGAFCGAMLAAKLPFLLGSWDGLLTGSAWFQDGKTILCGFVGGYFGVELAKWALHVQTRTGDSFAVPVAASVAIGRWGCFHVGCCYGTPTALPWAVTFANVDGLARHPTQIYESIFHATMALVLAGLLNAGVFRGNLMKFYIITYAVYRFFTEFIRPEARLWGELTAYQWATIAIAVLFGLLWYRDANNHATSALPHDAVPT